MDKRRVKKIFLVISVLIAIFCSVRIISNRVFCYDSNIAHPHIAELAIDLYNQNFDPDLTEEEKRCILTGAREEDTPTRWLNHFYDPVHNQGLKGVYLSAKSWAENPNKQTSYALGDQSWQRALADYKNNQKKLAFTELGHVLHIIADMAVPAHTRDDVHVMPGDSYEQFLKSNWDSATAGVIGKSVVKNISSLSSAFDALATYSNNNFYSDDTIEDNNYKILKISNYVSGVDKFKLAVVDDNLDGETYLFARRDIGIWDEFNTIEIKINHPDVLRNHTSLLVPEAVGYSAGVIKLFFGEAEKLSANDRDKNLPTFRRNLFGFTNLVIGKVVSGAQELGEAMKARLGGGSGEVYSEEVPMIQTMDYVSADSTDNIVKLTENTAYISPYQGEIKRGSGENVVKIVDKINTDNTEDDDWSDSNNLSPPVSPVSSPTVVTPVVAPAVYYGGGSGGFVNGANNSVDNPTSEATTSTTSIDVASTATSTPDIDNATLTITPDITSPTSTLPIDVPTSTLPIETPTSTLPIESPTSTPLIETPTSTPPTETTTSTPPIETPTSTLPTFTTSTAVVINEVAWAGTGARTANDEWIELYNNTDQIIDLTNWKLFVATKPIVLSGTLSPHEYYLMERTSDNTVLNIIADLIFTLPNGLSNSGEHLILKNSLGEVVDEVDCSGGWFAGTAGSESYPQAKYRSMERKSVLIEGNSADNWRSNIGQPMLGKNNFGNGDIMGTPRQPNNNFWVLKGLTYYYSNQIVDNIIHLTKDHSPYIFDYALEIPFGYTMIVEPGVVLTGRTKDAYFDVKGELQLNGTVEEPIIITSARDVVRLGQAVVGWLGEPEAGDWSRIEVGDAGKLKISEAQFYFGGTEFKKQGNWVYSLQNISQVVRNIAGVVEIDHSTFYNSFIGANDQQYSAVVWTETQIGKSASTTIKNSEFNGGWMAIKNFGQNNGQKIYSEISNNQFKNFLGSNGPVVATYHLPTLNNNILIENNKNTISLESVSLSNDTVLANGDYEIGGALTIPIGATLTVNSSTNLKMRLGSGIDVFGKLAVSGIDSAPVNIEPTGDDFWGRIDFKSGAIGDLHFANLRRGNFTQNTNPEDTGIVRALNANLKIEDCAFLDASRPQNMLLLNSSQTIIKNSRIAWSTDYESGTRWLTGIRVNNGTLLIDNVNFDRMDVGVDASVGGTVTKVNMPDENFQNIKKYHWLPEDLFTTLAPLDYTEQAPLPLEEIPALL